MLTAHVSETPRALLVHAKALCVDKLEVNQVNEVSPALMTLGIAITRPNDGVV